MANQQQKQPNNSSLLDIIAEKSSNTESYTNAALIKEKLNEALRIMAKREKMVRESTIMFKLSENVNSDKITALIEKEYCNSNNKPSATYWYDKEHAYVQFINESEKKMFLDWIQTNQASTLFRDSIQPPNDMGEHLSRKPIKVIINNVRKFIKKEIVETSLKKILGNNKELNFREGKPNAITGARAMMFTIDSEGFKILFGTLEGAIPYVCTASNMKTRLYPKVNCKPWACNNCFEFGRHECKGKVCAKCGGSGHLTKECDKSTKYCNNCKHRGHRARDTHCLNYLAEVAKELRKVSIPIEYFAEKELRFHLIKQYLQIN